MGIPLYNIPEVRLFLGRDMYGSTPLGFMKKDYRPLESHMIAARITAENPDEGFKHTSGSIERIKFRSTSNVWGYFSVGASGDSQFGHVFAKGAQSGTGPHGAHPCPQGN
jgi:acetyl-CoA carboxylase / biotin carboxylase 1